MKEGDENDPNPLTDSYIYTTPVDLSLIKNVSMKHFKKASSIRFCKTAGESYLYSQVGFCTKFKNKRS